FNWDTFYGYRNVKPGLLLYLKAASFFFIPNEAITTEEKEAIVDILQESKVMELATK
ncbi:MAG: YcxB family protein, partial [Desulfuromonadales bacterium]|nr:YcxB family protein [Desulfuromonadales bacterium]